MDLRIRAARYDDIVSMLVLLKQLFAIEADFHYDGPKQHRGLELLLKSERSVIVVAEVKSNVVGMITGQLLISTAEGGYSLLVEDVVVDPRWRRKGIGAELLKVVSAWGREQGASRYQLLADQENQHAIDFYNNNNWKQTNLICLRQKCGR